MNMKIDEITGKLRKSHYIANPRATRMTHLEIDDMLVRIANRRKDPMFYFQSHYIDNPIDYHSTEMIG